MLWVERYRPKNLDEFVATDELKDTIKELIKNPLDMPHFLFTSRSPGTGKTSLAKVIINELGIPMSDVLILNSSEDRKIETIRGKVKDFSRSMPKNKIRIVLMDEADGMLAASQEALRFLMEQYSTTCKFILTANYENKIIEPLQSRCTHIRLQEMPKQTMAERLVEICHKEQTNITEGLEFDIVNAYYPDMRKMVNKLQELAPDITEFKKDDEEKEKFYQILKTGEAKDARKYIIENGLDARELIKYVLQQEEKELSIVDVASLAFMCAEYDFRMVFGADPEVQMWGFIQGYMKMRK